MEIERVRLSQFRCFKGASFVFAPGINLFFGENGVGKSSLLEALHLFVTGYSFRTRKPLQLVKEGCEKAEVELYFKERAITRLLEWEYGEKGSFFFQKKKLKSVSAVVGLLPGVSLTPADLDIINGAREERRRFLDLILSQRDPLYLHHRIRYEKGLMRRNMNLKMKRFQSLDGIEIEMAKSGAYLIEARSKVVLELADFAAPLFRHLLGEMKELKLHYATKKGDLLSLWKQDRGRDSTLGYTLSGPHRDEVELLLNGKEVKHFGSEGEKKSYLLSLKLAHHALLKEANKAPPLLLLDDLTASLDPLRIERWWEMADGTGQIVVTSTTPLLKRGVCSYQITRESLSPAG
jgi:DNA replication and repair protein RecF